MFHAIVETTLHNNYLMHRERHHARKPRSYLGVTFYTKIHQRAARHCDRCSLSSYVSHSIQRPSLGPRATSGEVEAASRLRSFGGHEYFANVARARAGAGTEVRRVPSPSEASRCEDSVGGRAGLRGIARVAGGRPRRGRPTPRETSEKTAEAWHGVRHEKPRVG